MYFNTVFTSGRQIKFYFTTSLKLNFSELTLVHLSGLLMPLIKPPSTTTGAVMFYLTCTLCIVIIAPILIYWTFKLNQFKNTIVVRKRYPNIINIILILLLICIYIQVPLSVLAITPTSLPLLNTIHHSLILQLIESTLNVYLTNIITILIALRFWMIFYKINYTYSSSTSGMNTIYIYISLHT